MCCLINKRKKLLINPSSNTLDATIELNNSPTGVIYNPVNNEVYVTETSGTVAVINSTSQRVVETIQVGSQPTAISVDSDSGAAPSVGEIG